MSASCVSCIFLNRLHHIVYIFCHFLAAFMNIMIWGETVAKLRDFLSKEKTYNCIGIIKGEK